MIMHSFAKMSAGIDGMMPVHGEGDGSPSRGRSRVETASRSVLRKTGPSGGKTGTATQLFGGVVGVKINSGKKWRTSRKYSHIPSTVSRFMLTGISEPRRFRSLPVAADVHVPFASNSRKFTHVSSTVSKFMKTGISEPRRYRSVPVVVEEVHMPVINKKKKFAHVTSGIKAYIRTGVLPAKRSNTSLPLEESVSDKRFGRRINQINASLPKQRSTGGARSKAGTRTDNSFGIPVPREPKFVECCEPERVEDIIANLICQLRIINAEAQPTEAAELMIDDLNAKFPNLFELLNSKDPFDLVFALGLGYHYKFLTDYGEDQNSKADH